MSFQYHAMPPMVVELLMRCHSRPAPNGFDGCTRDHATSPSMTSWVARLRYLGILEDAVTVDNLIDGSLMDYLTPKGQDLVHRICNTPFEAIPCSVNIEYTK